MNAPASPVAQVEPKHTHYVSTDNHCIYPAMASPAGYEDEHPNEWRPATPQETQRYINGDAPSVIPNAAPIDLSAYAAPAVPSTPASIVLAPDDPLPPTAPAPPISDYSMGQSAPPAPAPPAAAPPAAAPPAAIPPAPATPQE